MRRAGQVDESVFLQHLKPWADCVAVNMQRNRCVSCVPIIFKLFIKINNLEIISLVVTPFVSPSYSLKPSHFFLAWQFLQSTVWMLPA
jgi:hypothetical protein